MTREEVLNSIALKKRFCKDSKITMAVFDNPYFLQRLSDLNPFNLAEDRFDLFCKELEQFATEQDYFEYYNNVKDAIIETIKKNEAYDRFNTSTLASTSANNYSSRNVYIEDNENQWFVSLDMKKANFSALRQYSADIFNGASTWEEFVSNFTNNTHIIRSKYIRQVVMGVCNPKRQIQYEKKLMGDLLDGFLVSDYYNASKLEVFSLAADEIILKLNVDETNLSLLLKEIDVIFKDIKQYLNTTDMKDIVRINTFYLKKISGTTGWLKVIANNSDSNEVDHLDNKRFECDFKCLDAETYHQVVKHFMNTNKDNPMMTITENDLVFYHNGRLGRFLNPIDNPFENDNIIWATTNFCYVKPGFFHCMKF